MTTTDIELPSDKAVAARADFVSQTTAVEQARAVAEVQAAVIIAQQVPRAVAEAVRQMRESCSQPGLAMRAFYSYARGGSTVAGASVHLARELARVWGNVQYGIQELRRDDAGKYSEMQAWAWDVQTNTRSSTTFVVPHKRDKKGGPVAIVDLRDVYENNANMGARRLREAIFSILPPWFTADAQAICTKTLEEGGDVPMPKRIANTVSAFAKLGVSVDQLERRVGRGQNQWTPLDLAQLTVLGESLKQGTISLDEAFEGQRVTAAEIAGSTTSSEAAKSEPVTTEQPALDADDAAWVDDAKGAKK